MSFVVDASVSIGWFFEDEVTPRGQALWERLVEEGACSPSVWRLEMLNAFVRAVRSKCITAARARDFTDRFLRIESDVEEASSDRLAAVLDVALERNLSAYDASYLELAVRLNVPLATNDAHLADAARALDVEVL